MKVLLDINVAEKNEVKAKEEIDNAQANKINISEDDIKKEEVINKTEEEVKNEEGTNTNDEVHSQSEVENNKNPEEVIIKTENENNTGQRDEPDIKDNKSLEESIIMIEEDYEINKEDTIPNNKNIEIDIKEEPHTKHAEEIIKEQTEEATVKKYVLKGIHFLGEVIDINIKTFLYASNRVKEHYNLEYPYNHLLVAFVTFMILYCIANILPGPRQSSVVI